MARRTRTWKRHRAARIEAVCDVPGGPATLWSDLKAEGLLREDAPI